MSRWEKFALLRGTCICFIVFLRDVYDPEIMRASPGWGDPIRLLTLLVPMSAALAVAEVVAAWLPGPWMTEGRRGWRRAVLCATCGFAPYLLSLAQTSIQLPDRSFIWRHRRALEAAVRNGTDNDHIFDSIERRGSRTIIRFGAYGVGDSYFIIHDPSTFPEVEDKQDVDEFLRSSRWKIAHIWGPWYVLVT